VGDVPGGRVVISDIAVLPTLIAQIQVLVMVVQIACGRDLHGRQRHPAPPNH
jgi:hypothetical protein